MCILTILFIVGKCLSTHAQVPLVPGMLPGQQSDNAAFDSALASDKKKWVNIPPIIHSTTLHSERKLQVDTSILLSHRRISRHGWFHYLGNYGTAALNMKFDPDWDPGPQPGYNIYEPYQYHLDSVRYYNTTRPFSQFNYSLGGAQEQTVSLLHTQNIHRRWNVALEFRNINSPGYYLNQFSNFNGGFFSTNYTSKNKRYSIRAAIVQNKNRSDENGGIVSDTFLTNPNIVDRKQIPTQLPSLPAVYDRSVILNQYRNTEFLVENRYRWGLADTLYNEDSTAATPRFTPRFGLKHQFHVRLSKHRFHDRFPNASRYAFIQDSIPFINADTNRNEQVLQTFANRFSFNGFIGKAGRQAAIEAGLGIRFDRLYDDLEVNRYSDWLINNFVFGEINKEALDSFSWSYRAAVNFYFGGSHVGDLKFDAEIAKQLRRLGGFTLGVQQAVSSAPVAFTRFATNYYVRESSFQKQTTTRLSAGLNIEKLGLTLSGHSLLTNNLIYFSDEWKPVQSSSTFNVLQVQAVQNLKLGKYRMYSEALVQQPTGDAPINLPLLMLRHISAFDSRIFEGKLWLTTGIELRYHTPFITAGYTPFFNQFFYRSAGALTSNLPEVTAFFNFKVKQFRLSISGDQLQQLIFPKNIAHFPNYPMQDVMYRLGIQWILYN